MNLEEEIYEAIKERLEACGSFIKPSFIMTGITPILDRYKSEAAQQAPADPGGANVIIIEEEVLEILPIESNEGQLYQVVDTKKNKGALLRLKRR
jgi:hypothetical protein